MARGRIPGISPRVQLGGQGFTEAGRAETAGVLSTDFGREWRGVLLETVERGRERLGRLLIEEKAGLTFEDGFQRAACS